MTIVIRKNEIVEVGPSGKVSVPPGIAVLDGSKTFVIPGLWDMHVHTGAKEVFFPLYIANGITGIRDAGGDLPRATGNGSTSLDELNRWKGEIERGETLGPRMVVTGPIMDGPEPYWPGVTTPIRSPQEARRVVRSLKEKKADFVKVYVLLPAETYFAIADESKKQGLRFAGHVPKVLTAVEAAQAGQRCIEHLNDILRCNSVPPKELYAWLRAHDTWNVPTLVVTQTMIVQGPDLLKDERLKYIPAYIREIWKKSGWHNPRTPEELRRNSSFIGAELWAVKEMHEAGVSLLAGSDSANPYTYPGFSLQDELGLLVKAGLTPLQALRLATTEPARFLEKQDILGTIEKGKRADLVLLDGNPLEDISNTRRIRAVVVDGKLLERDELKHLLDGAASAAEKMVADSGDTIPISRVVPATSHCTFAASASSAAHSAIQLRCVRQSRGSLSRVIAGSLLPGQCLNSTREAFGLATRQLPVQR
jgi:imidazolonepropionase-like amidohydrolase